MGFDVLCIWIVPAYECSSSEPGELSRAWGAMHYNIIPTSPSGSFQWHRKGFISLPVIQLISMESSENRVESIISEGNEGGIHQRPASQRHIYHLHRETPLGLAVRNNVFISPPPSPPGNMLLQGMSQNNGSSFSRLFPKGNKELTQILDTKS